MVKTVGFLKETGEWEKAKKRVLIKLGSDSVWARAVPELGNIVKAIQTDVPYLELTRDPLKSGDSKTLTT
jgi:hypothetical protein